MAQEWRKLAQDGTLLRGLLSHLARPGGGPKRGFSGDEWN
jgi:hypothetical protein